jgi:hypothetical protein
MHNNVRQPVAQKLGLLCVVSKHVGQLRDLTRIGLASLWLPGCRLSCVWWQRWRGSRRCRRPSQQAGTCMKPQRECCLTNSQG